MILVVNLLWMACFALPAVAANPPIADLAFAHDGKSVFTVSQSGVQQLEWPSLKELRALEVSFANLHCVLTISFQKVFTTISKYYIVSANYMQLLIGRTLKFVKNWI